MKNSNIRKLIRGIFVLAIFAISFFFYSGEAKAVDVDTYDKLETALKNTSTGTTYIRITGNIVMTEQIDVTAGTKIIYSDKDYNIYRSGKKSEAKRYLFNVSSGATLRIGTTRGTGTVTIGGNSSNRNESSVQQSLVNVNNGTFRLGEKGVMQNNITNRDPSDKNFTGSQGGAIRAVNGSTVEVYGIIKNCATGLGWTTGSNVANRTVDYKVGGAIYADGKTDSTSSSAKKVNVTIDGATIAECYALYGNGGGIWMDYANVTIKGDAYISYCYNSGNTTYNKDERSGGAVFQLGGNLNIQNGTFENNGFAAEGKSATTHNGGFLEVAGNGKLNITGGTYRNNKAAQNGGCIEFLSSTASTISNATFTGNMCVETGGAIKMHESAALTIEGCTFNSNKTFGDNDSTGAGGAISATGTCTVNINSSEFSLNQADVDNENSSGGAIMIYANSMLNIDKGLTSSSTFVNNEAGYGGAITVLGKSIIYNAIIHDNTALHKRGGGINVQEGANVQIYGSTKIYNNVSTKKDGGGICNFGTLTVTGSTQIYNNETFLTGGGIYNDEKGTITINGSYVKVYDNKTIGEATKSHGGGICNIGTATVKSATIDGNTVTGGGGGVYNTGTLTLDNAKLQNNNAGKKGGGLNAQVGKVTIKTSATISGNTATEVGGGIFIKEGATVESIGSLAVSGNTAITTGGGIYNEGTYSHKPAVNITYNPNIQVINNISTGDGAGIYNSGTFSLDNKTFTVSTVNPVFKVEGNTNNGSGTPGVYNSGSFFVGYPYKFTVTNNKAKYASAELINVANATATVYGTSAYIGETVKVGSGDMYAINSAGTFNFCQNSGTSTITGSRNRTINNTGSMTINGAGGVANITNNANNSSIVYNSGTLNVTPANSNVVVIKPCTGINASYGIQNTGRLTFGGTVNGDNRSTNVLSLLDITPSYLAVGDASTEIGIYTSGSVTHTGNIYGCKKNGVRTTANGVFAMNAGSIYENGTEATNGGGIYNDGTVTLSGGNIYSNKAQNGGGIYKSADGTINQTGGYIYSNVATLRGSGVYLTSGGYYNVSDTASVNTNNDVYEESGSFIHIVSPGLNVEDKVKFMVTPADPTYEVGRVIAFLEFNSKTAEQQLYGKGTADDERTDKDVTKMFAVANDKFTVRPGNKLNEEGRQNLFSNANFADKGNFSSTGSKAIYLSEKYKVKYMPNVPAEEENSVKNMPGVIMQSDEDKNTYSYVLAGGTLSTTASTTLGSYYYFTNSEATDTWNNFVSNNKDSVSTSITLSETIDKLSQQTIDFSGSGSNDYAEYSGERLIIKENGIFKFDLNWCRTNFVRYQNLDNRLFIYVNDKKYEWNTLPDTGYRGVMSDGTSALVVKNGSISINVKKGDIITFVMDYMPQYDNTYVPYNTSDMNGTFTFTPAGTISVKNSGYYKATNNSLTLMNSETGEIFDTSSTVYLVNDQEYYPLSKSTSTISMGMDYTFSEAATYYENKFWYENYRISSTVPEREGWDFVTDTSWNTESAGTGNVHSPNSAYNDNADLTIYAIWKNTYVVPLYHVVMDTSGNYPINDVKVQEKETYTESGLNTTCNVEKTESILTDGKLNEDFVKGLIDDYYVKEGITKYKDVKAIGLNADGTVNEEQSAIFVYYEREKHKVTLSGDIGISELSVTNNDFNPNNHIDFTIVGSDRGTVQKTSTDFGVINSEYFEQTSDGLVALKNASLKITVTGECYNQTNYLRVGSGGRYEVEKSSSGYVYKAVPGIYNFSETYEIDVKAGEVIDYVWEAIDPVLYERYKTAFPDVTKYLAEGTIEILDDTSIVRETAELSASGTDLSVGEGYLEFKEFTLDNSEYFKQTDNGLEVIKDVTAEISLHSFSHPMPKVYVNGEALYADSNIGTMYYAGGPSGYKLVKYLEYEFKKGDIVTIRLPEIPQSSIDYYGSNVSRKYDIKTRINVSELKNASIETANKSFSATDNDEQINNLTYIYYAKNDGTSVTVGSNNKENTDFWGFSYNEDKTNPLEDNPKKEQTIVLPNEDTVIYAHTLRGGNVQINCWLQNQSGEGYTLLDNKSGEVFTSSREINLYDLLFTDNYGVVGPSCIIDGQTRFHNDSEAECVKVDGEWFNGSIANVGEGSVIDVYFDRYTYKATFIAGKRADSVESWSNGTSEIHDIKITSSFDYTDYISVEDAKGITVNTENVMVVAETYDENKNKISSYYVNSSNYYDISNVSYVRFYTPIGSVSTSSPLNGSYSLWYNTTGKEVVQTVYAYISDGSVLGIEDETPSKINAAGYGEDNVNYAWFETAKYVDGSEDPYSSEREITIEMPNKDVSYTFAAVPDFTTVILNHYIMTEDGIYNDGADGTEDKPDVTVLYEHMEVEVDSISVLDCVDKTITSDEYYYLDKVVVNGVEYDADDEKLSTLEYISDTKDSTYIKYYYHNRKADRIKVRVYADPVYSDVTIEDEDIKVEEVNEGNVNTPIYETRLDIGETITFNPILDESKLDEGYKFEQRTYSMTTPDNATDESKKTINPDASQTVTISPEYIDEDGYISIYISVNIVPISYTVIYDVNLPAGETAYTGHMDNTTARYNESFNLTKNDYEIDGYKFLGWADENDRENNVVTYEDMEEVMNLAKTQGAEVTLYAVWHKLESGKPNIHVEDLFFRVGEDITYDNLFEYVIISDGNGNVMDNRTAGLEIIGVSQVVNEYVNHPIYPADDAYATSDPIAEADIENYINTDYERTFLVTVQAHNFKKNGDVDKYGKASFTVKVWQTHTISKYVRAIDLYSLDTIPLDSKWASGELNTRLITSLRKSGLEEAKYVYRFSSEDVKDIRSQFKDNGYSWDAIKNWWKTTITPLASPEYFDTLRSQY